MFETLRDVFYIVLKTLKMNNEIFNVGLSNANLSKIELCKEIKKQIPAFNFFESN